MCTPSINKSIPSRIARLMVASMPCSTALQVSTQSIIASFESPIENEERCNAGLAWSSSVERRISLIASVDINRANLLLAPMVMATVDFPVAVAPAIISSLGGRLAMVLAVVPARPTVRAMVYV